MVAWRRVISLIAVVLLALTLLQPLAGTALADDSPSPDEAGQTTTAESADTAGFDAVESADLEPTTEPTPELPPITAEATSELADDPACDTSDCAPLDVVTPEPDPVDDITPEPTPEATVAPETTPEGDATTERQSGDEASPESAPDDTVTADDDTNTPAGSSVQISDPTHPVSLTFETVTEAGTTSVSALANPFDLAFYGGASNVDLAAAFGYEIATTAVTSGTISVCVEYEASDFPGGGDVELLELHPFGFWNPVATAAFPAETTVCGTYSGDLASVALVQQAVPGIGFDFFVEDEGAGVAVGDDQGHGCVSLAPPSGGADITLCDVDDGADGAIRYAGEIGAYTVTAYTPPEGVIVAGSIVGRTLTICSGCFDGILTITHVRDNTGQSDGAVTVWVPGASGVSVTFASVTSLGATWATALDPGSQPPLPAGYDLFSALVYDIGTTATYTGPLTVCVAYPFGFFSNQTAPTLFHLAAGAWTAISDSGVVTPGRICGAVDTLSPFAVAEISPFLSGGMIEVEIRDANGPLLDETAFFDVFETTNCSIEGEYVRTIPSGGTFFPVFFAPGAYCIRALEPPDGYGDIDLEEQLVTVVEGQTTLVAFTYGTVPQGPDPSIWGLVRIELLDSGVLLDTSYEGCVTIDPPQMDGQGVFCDRPLIGGFVGYDGVIEIYVKQQVDVVSLTEPGFYNLVSDLPDTLFAAPGTVSTVQLEFQEDAAGGGFVVFAETLSTNGTTVGSYRVVPGARFRVTAGGDCDPNDEVIATVVTDSIGQAIMEGLAIGDYCIDFLDAPQGFVISDPGPIPFTTEPGFLEPFFYYFAIEPPLVAPDPSDYAEVVLELVDEDGNPLPVAASGLDGCVNVIHRDLSNSNTPSRVCDSTVEPGIDGRINVFVDKFTKTVTVRSYSPPSGYIATSSLPAEFEFTFGDVQTYRIEHRLLERPTPRVVFEVVDDRGVPVPTPCFTIDEITTETYCDDDSNESFDGTVLIDRVFAPGEYTYQLIGLKNSFFGTAIEGVSGTWTVGADDELVVIRVVLTPLVRILIELDGYEDVLEWEQVCIDLKTRHGVGPRVCDPILFDVPRGEISLFSLREGEYTASVVRSPLGYGVIDPVKLLTVQRGETAEVEFTFFRREDETLTIHVKDEEGAPVHDACFFAGEAGSCDIFDGRADGVIRFYNITGTVEVGQFSAVPGFALPDPITVDLRQQNEVDVTLERIAPSITIIAVDRNGKRLLGAEFILDQGFPARFFAPDDSDGVIDGSAAFYGMSPGAYEVEVLFSFGGDDWHVSAGSVSIPTNEPLILEITEINLLDEIIVDLTDATGAPAPGGCIAVYEYSFTYFGDACDDDGDGTIAIVTVRPLVNGYYRILETTAPDGFELAAPRTVSLGSARPLRVTIIHGANTPVGSDVTVEPEGVPGASVTFAAVTTEGLTTITEVPASDVQPLPDGAVYQLSEATYYEVSTTAVVSPPITVCVPSSDSEDRLLHLAGGAWDDVTDAGSPAGGTVCGTVEHLSLFAVVPENGAGPDPTPGTDPTPGPTPTPTPDDDGEPVTQLPNTGTGGGGASGIALVLGAVALCLALGHRARPSRVRANDHNAPFVRRR